jgi:uridine phosphorylase
MNKTSKELQPHIKVREVDRFCLLSGDPARVPIIAEKLINSRKVSNYRGLVAYKGLTPNKKIPVTALTTGMGAPSNAIVIEEAYKAGGRIFIRIGSCGSLSKKYSIGTIFIPHGAIRDDGTSPQMIPIEVPAIAHPELYYQLRDSAKDENVESPFGLVWTTGVYYSEDNERVTKWRDLGAVCVEMESSFLFSLHGLKPDIKVASILTSDGDLEEYQNIYNGDTETRIKVFRKSIELSIKIALHAIESF